MILHRWIRDVSRRGWICTKPEDGWKMIAACEGCGRFISDESVSNVLGYKLEKEKIDFTPALLNLLVTEIEDLGLS